MSILLDTGPLVAVLRKDDAWHQACIDQFKQLNPPLITCWPVLTEAAWLLRRTPSAVQSLLSFHTKGLYRIAPLDWHCPVWIAEFFQRFNDREPQLADAVLMYLAERDKIDAIFTLDRRDFSVYRLNNGQALKLLPE